MNGKDHREKPQHNPDSDTLPPSPLDPAKGESKIAETAGEKSEGDENGTKTTVRKITWLEIALLFFNAGVVIVGIIALVIYSGQLDVMRGTLNEMKRGGQQSTDQVWRAIDNINWLARSMDWSVKQSQEANRASERQSKIALDASVEASRNTLRPYVHVIRMSLLGTPANGQTIQGQAEVVNSGKTPGIRVAVCADLAMRNGTAVLPDGYPCPAPGNPPEPAGMVNSQGVIGPNSPPVIAQSRGTTITQTSGPPFVQALTSRVLRLYFYGDITYFELLKPQTIHHTEFCGLYNMTTGQFDVCEHHNNVD